MAGSPAKTMRFPAYQIDFSAVASGKRVAATKRRIRWRFGFPNLQALEAGRTAQDARGEEHEVVVVWSITSGKRQILMDGKEITYNSSRTGVLDHSWATRGNHVVKVICHAAAPMTPTPGFRQYDLFIDGQSFFNFPKVYELGLRGMATTSPRAGAGSYAGGGGGGSPRAYSYEPEGPPISGPRTPEEEEAELQRAINASLAETRSHLNEKQESAPAPVADLLDLGGGDGFASSQGDSLVPYVNGPPQSQPPYGYNAPSQHQQPDYNQAPPAGYGQPSSYGQPPPPQQAYPALMPPEGAQQQYGGTTSHQTEYGQPHPPGAYAYGQQPPQVIYGAPQPQQQAEYGYAAAPQDPFAPKPPSFHETANEILKGYGPGPSDGSYNYQPGVLNPPMPPAPDANGYGSSFAHDSSASYEEQQYDPSPMNGGGLTMDTLAITEEEPQNPFDAVIKKLVNIDRIDEPAEVQYKLTMKKQENEKKGKAGKSVPKPPVAQGLVGTGATLSQIKQVKPETQIKEDIMRAPPAAWHPDAVHAGALVVHGQGPPPLGQPQGMVGFGVGYNPMAAQMYNGGGGGPSYYGGPQQQQQQQQQHGMMANGHLPQQQAMQPQYGYR
ncbi:hypothetical protein MPSEU_000562700 [Mayamaea pseudoterrestris]|nr:hypothetical protein MPSEU_000562700 [Mayamaea pseudoterrestris]